MAFNNSFTAVVGATYTAAQYNTHVRDNFTAVWVYTTAGDIVYATSATALARLGKPSVDSLLKNTSSGVPSWLAIAALPGRFHTSGSNFSNSGPNTTSTSYSSTGITFNLTLTEICTVFAFAFGAARKDSGTHDGFFSIAINGTIDPNENVSLRNTIDTPFATMYRATAVPVGTRAVDLRYRTANASDALYATRGALFAMAFVEG